MRHLHTLERLAYGHGSSAGLPDLPPPNPWVTGMLLADTALGI
jgi:hypothetical protein